MTTEFFNAYDFINTWNNINSTREQFLTTVIFQNSTYYIELNGIHITDTHLIEEDILQINTWNNRKIQLKITDDLKITMRDAYEKS